ncbi:MAG: DUF4190 domain-containing protein [Propionibacteriaceae bacterium]
MSQYPTQPAPGSPYGAGTGVAEDPGRTLGIVGLVLAIVASLIGLIISIVAYRKSKAAGFKNGVALAGIIIGCITTVLSIVYAIVVVTMLPTMMNY